MKNATNMQLAAAICAALIEAGVRELVVCAGARNTPLILTILETPGLRVWHHFEERSAGFFALGRIQAGAGPVAVITTSGTAVAELLPAVIEGYYQGLPLIICSADRPKQFRGSGAPQSIRQPGLFAQYAEEYGDVEVGDERIGFVGWAGKGPAHLNVCFGEPLLDGPVCEVGSVEVRGVEFGLSVPRWGGFGCGEGERLLVVVGRLRRAERRPVADFLRNLKVGVWLEAESGLWGEEGILERREGGLVGVTHVLRLGGVPAAGFWRALETENAIRVLSWSMEGFRGLGRVEGVEWEAVDLRGLKYLGEGVGVGGMREMGEGLDGEPVDEEERVVWWVSRVMAAGAHVFLGNSLPIRHWQRVAERVFGREIYANRGANGIDGECSSFLGVAVGACELGVEAWGILGDLTVLYDCAAGYVLPQMPAGKVRLVVLNNQGGGIFSRLPYYCVLPEKARQWIRNQHTASFEHLAGMWGWEYRLVRCEADLEGLPEAPVILEWRAGGEE